MENALGYGAVWATLQGKDSRYFGEFGAYVIPIEQSDRVQGTEHIDIVHQGPSTVGYK